MRETSGEGSCLRAVIVDGDMCPIWVCMPRYPLRLGLRDCLTGRVTFDLRPYSGGLPRWSCDGRSPMAPLFHRSSREFERLQRICDDLFTVLNIPLCRDIFTFCERFGCHRDRPIRLVPMALQGAGSCCGLWMALPTTDYIVYEADTSKMHQAHIIAHELAHMICGHRNADIPGGSGALLLFPDLNPATIREAFSRGTYSTQQEQEAEIMAALVLRGLSRPQPSVAGPWPAEPARADPTREDIVSRIERTLLPPESGPDAHA